MVAILAGLDDGATDVQLRLWDTDDVIRAIKY